MKETSVVNIRSGEHYDVYIGRGSKWGNPFTHLRQTTKALVQVSSRAEAIERYEAYLRSQLELMTALSELEGKVLGCFCKPKDCHGDVLVRVLKEITDGA